MDKQTVIEIITLPLRIVAAVLFLIFATACLLWAEIWGME